EKVAHVGENLLSRLRDGELKLSADITSGLLAMVDAVRHMLAEIQATEHDGNDDYPDLLARLKALQSGTSPAPPNPPAAHVPESPVVAPVAPEIVPAPANAQAKNSEPPPEIPAPQFRPSPLKIGGLLVDRGALEPQDLALALQEQERGDRRRLGEILVAL